ncbi:MAG TPA: CHASE2 domain-containing protein [Bryobacteraceae bacterium]|jgi:signal transduction histidine kinase
MDQRGWKRTAAYVGLLATVYVVAVAGSWMFGSALDNAAYDFMFRLYQPPPWQTQSVLLAIDEDTINSIPGGMYGIRPPLADALRLVAKGHPKAVAVDVILAEKRDESTADPDLAQALCSTPNLVLSAELVREGQPWEYPIKAFKDCATAIGHVHARPDPGDSRTRAIPLVKRAGHDQLKAISLQAFALSRGEPIVTFSSSSDVEVGKTIIPIPGTRFSRISAGEVNELRPMRVRFLPPGMPPIPQVSLKALLDHPERAREFTGKVVFVGSTATTLPGDRLLTPSSPQVPITGIEIHAEAFETMAQGLFLTDVADIWVVLFSLLVAAAMGLAFGYLPGWRAYVTATSILVAAQVIPYFFFTHRYVFSFATAASVAWLEFMAAAAYYHLVVRRNWLVEQSARTRYQQAMHFVTHEMRTPLSAIQGSSELISRYSLNEEKRKQIAQVINSESKRLAKMVEIFLNVERLSAGQMELKHEAISVREMVEVCTERTRPLAERKHIGLTLEPVADELQLTGDRELMEYACYNLLTNAVKYSPQNTQVTAKAWNGGGHVRIAVRDQGIGMDQKELKQIFQKFFRTKRAEESGEAGTGIGLSIVQQIVEQHGGQIEVTSQPGVGSCFTLVLPTPAERH